MPRKIPDAEMFSLSFAMTRAYTELAHDLLTSFLTNPTRFRDAAKRFQTILPSSPQTKTFLWGPTYPLLCSLRISPVSLTLAAFMDDIHGFRPYS